ncbi:response regulator transcription factor [Spirosoma sp. KCTC 42546]|uniref:response regulator n=1 Tax=Spirosoma sp. KCTC 42546 TaxID=2520506 RepID=UPI0011582845|nr:response regulator transcription factor [Spirosoma sp. KCTC 42546]QDK79405.1 response regulator transcription factor [Spirosoma sp. KCTC 42546]
MSSSIRVLLTDDHEIILDSLSLLLSRIEGVEVIGTLNDSRQVVNFLHENEVDILLTDMDMPLLNGINLTLQVRQQFPQIKVLMLTVSEDADKIREAFRAGISGYVMKRAGKAELEKAIKTLARGEKYFSESVMTQLMALPVDTIRPSDEAPAPITPLTDREIEIIKLVAQELSTNAIADKLFISPGTVETHRHNILRKLGVKNSIGIIKYAVKHGLL